jgi:hypothetical protein
MDANTDDATLEPRDLTDAAKTPAEEVADEIVQRTAALAGLQAEADDLEAKLDLLRGRIRRHEVVIEALKGIGAGGGSKKRATPEEMALRVQAVAKVLDEAAKGKKLKTKEVAKLANLTPKAAHGALKSLTDVEFDKGWWR